MSRAPGHDKTEMLAKDILSRAQAAQRYMVALAGPPGSGKSTLAGALQSILTSQGQSAVVVPMDGFHFDDQVLLARGHRDRKGAPHTFDIAGFGHVLKRLRQAEPDVAIPIFDRSLELSRAGAAVIPADLRFLLIEGNYLLLDEDPWRSLFSLFDLRIFLDVPEAELERRLMERWLGYGLGPDRARAWIASNDLPNIRHVLTHRQKADIILPG